MDLTYSMTDDPNYTVLTDIANKCGLLGGSTSDITVDYAIHVSPLMRSVNVNWLTGLAPTAEFTGVFHSHKADDQQQLQFCVSDH